MNKLKKLIKFHKFYKRCRKKRQQQQVKYENHMFKTGIRALFFFFCSILNFKIMMSNKQ